MTNCGAPGCTNRSTENKNISFHRLPSKNEELKKKWLHNLKRKHFPANVFVCSDHFEPRCFKRDLRAELMGTKPRHELEEDAVPTLFQHSENASKRNFSLERSSKKVKLDVVQEALNNYDETLQSSNKEIGCSTDDLITVKEAAIQNSVKTRSIRTQYHIDDFCDVVVPEVNKPLMVKFKPTKKYRDASTNTETLSKLPELKEVVSSDEEDFSLDENSDSDLSFQPESDSSIDSEDEELSYKEIPEVDLEKGTKLIVFWSCLMTLLNVCQICCQPAKISRVFVKGTKVIVDTLCELKHKFSWHSQPNQNCRAEGNVSLAASIFLSGGTFERINDLFKIARIPFFSHTTFYKIQKKLILPAIHRVFTTQRQLLYDDARERGKIDFLGDGRCDSPGYNAKYGTYTVMDSNTGMILDMHVSHVGLTGTSAKMELDGLKQILQRLEDNSIEINSLTTDRHKQVRCFLRKYRKDILHQFDVWHFAKNIKKKLLEAAKKKCCAELGPWIKAIINHFWWCCATCEGNVTLLREKWISILYHVINVHEWENHTLFKECAHREYTLHEMKTKAWLKESSFAYNALRKIVTDKSLLKDLKYLTEFNHTGTLEVYHSVYNKYSPKRLHFSYAGMIARAQLTCLDFNSGVGLEQRKNKNEKLQFKHQYSKITKSWVVKKIPEKKEKFTYINHILDEINDLQTSNDKYETPKLENVPKYIGGVEKPKKEETIANMKSRFRPSK